MNKQIYYRKIIIALTIILVIFGVYMVYSSSNIWAKAKFNDSFYYLKRQSLFALVGFLGFFLASRISTNFLKKHAPHLVFISLALLILVLIPGIGIERNGSRSWFGIGSFAIQPSELFKIAIVTYTASFLSEHYEETKKVRAFFKVIFWAVFGFVLMMIQPDFGTAIVMMASIVLMMFTSKLPIKYFIFMGGLAITMMVVLIIIAPYRFERITAFLDPWSDPLGSGFQIIQSLYAIGPGALLGNGLLNSYQKHFYLPEPQTDFIFAIVVEELGLIGGLFLIAGFGTLFSTTFKYAKTMKDPFDAFLVTGLMGLIAIQVVINLGVVVSLFPVTGITLPLISYGGSSLSVVLCSLGIIVGRKNKEEKVYESSLSSLR